MIERAASKGKVFLICWTTYVVTYLCRVNLSSVMTKLAENMNLTTTQLGLAGSSFFFVYAIGQLINGYIGDKISPYKFVATAILGTGILNVLISISNNFWCILLLWSMNGYFQSMIWGPLMRILSEQYDQKHNAKISTGMATSMVTGYITSWVVFGRAFLYSPWQAYFWVPAIMALGTGMIWLYLIRENKNVLIKNERALRERGALLRLFNKERIWVVAFVCLCLGLIKESLSLWAPLLFTEMLNIKAEDSVLLIIIIPLANFAGIWFTNRLIKRLNGNVKKTLFCLFAIACTCSVSLYLVYSISVAASILCIAAVSAMMYGCNTILLSFVPISFGRHNIVSTLVGVFDFSSYVGAAISSVLLGFALASQNYYTVFAMWIAVLLLAICVTPFFRLSSSTKNKTVN